MKAYILVDENKIVRCMATEESNLHDDKLHMDKYHAERQGTVGDEYDSKADTWISRPENYPQPTQTEIYKAKIQAEIVSIQRAKAIQSLIDKGELLADYIDAK